MKKHIIKVTNDQIREFSRRPEVEAYAFKNNRVSALTFKSFIAEYIKYRYDLDVTVLLEEGSTVVDLDKQISTILGKQEPVVQQPKPVQPKPVVQQPKPVVLDKNSIKAILSKTEAEWLAEAVDSCSGESAKDILTQVIKVVALCSNTADCTADTLEKAIDIDSLSKVKDIMVEKQQEQLQLAKQAIAKQVGFDSETLFNECKANPSYVDLIFDDPTIANSIVATAEFSSYVANNNIDQLDKDKFRNELIQWLNCNGYDQSRVLSDLRKIQAIAA